MSSYSYLRRKLAKKTLLDMYESRLPQYPNAYPRGNVFFVDGTSGSNSYGGKTWDHAFKTITYALTKCTSWQHDIIYVVRETGFGGLEDTPITIAKHQIHLIALDSPQRPCAKPVINYGGTEAGLLITGNGVEVAGFDIGGGDAAGDACIEIGTAAPWDICIHDCVFGYINTHGYDGIRGGGPYMIIYDCLFGKVNDRDGIRIETNATRGFIGLPGHGNIFRECVGQGIDIVGPAVLGGIHDNRFSVTDDEIGEAIYFKHANSSGCYIAGNQVGEGQAAMGTVPYCDLGGNDWGLNYYDIRAIMPNTTGS